MVSTDVMAGAGAVAGSRSGGGVDPASGSGLKGWVGHLLRRMRGELPAGRNVVRLEDVDPVLLRDMGIGVAPRRQRPSHERNVRMGWP
jgi:hypothetical protein